MTCTIIKPAGGGVMFICGHGHGIEGCSICCACATTFCDWPTGGHGTCSKPLCDDHRHPIHSDLDLCPVHYGVYQGGRVPLKLQRLQATEAPL